MKVYISCDMEGVAGICTWTQVDSRNQGPDYAISRRLMTAEVRAAIEGARAAGATDILVNDSHGAMSNLNLEEFPSDIRVISGNRKPFSMVEGLDASFGGAFFIGYHGAAGDENAVLSHTYTPSVIYNAYVNGIRCGEALLNAGILGYFGVPLLLITGDRKTVEGTRALIATAHGVIVKESIGNFAANSIMPAAACAMIGNAARACVQDAKSGSNVFRFDPPITLEVDLCKVEQADLVALIPGIERTAARSVRFVHDDFRVIFKTFVAAFRLGATA